jgi:hypothetical protein
MKAAGCEAGRTPVTPILLAGQDSDHGAPYLLPALRRLPEHFYEQRYQAKGSSRSENQQKEAEKLNQLLYPLFRMQEQVNSFLTFLKVDVAIAVYIMGFEVFRQFRIEGRRCNAFLAMTCPFIPD